MRMVRHGTLAFEVNSNTSQDYNLLTGSGQGDPKSSFAFNLGVVPLNHYLASSPDVPRYKIGNQGVEPISFADDNLLLLDGDKVDDIIRTVEKIKTYRKVSGLSLNPPKCEFLAINCNPIETQRLANVTGMEQVRVLKHLGLKINSEGRLTHQDNILPVMNAMERIADSLSTSTATPLGRAIYARSLLTSKYLHRIQNYNFHENELTELRRSVLELTWTRHRVGTDTSSTRVHIAGSRVAQPLSKGGLGVPDPIIQTQSLKLAWIRKLANFDDRLWWAKLLEHRLDHINRPSIATHFQLGSAEWLQTGVALEHLSGFWASVFLAAAKFMELSHMQDKAWHLIPILGYEGSDFTHISTSSVAYRNHKWPNGDWSPF